MVQYGYIKHSELSHHGIKGQKWGIRRYQNADGSLTASGRERYGISSYKQQTYNNISKEIKNSQKIALNERNDNIWSVKKDKSLTRSEKQNKINEIYKQYKETGNVILNEYKKKYGDKRIKAVGDLDIAQRVSYIPAGLTILGAGAYVTKRIIDDFSVVREDDRRYYRLKKYSPGEVLKYEIF